MASTWVPPIRLTQGALPYRDFAFVQPPGILLLMTPAAAVAKVAGTAAAMSFARLLTVFASTACVPLGREPGAPPRRPGDRRDLRNSRGLPGRHSRRPHAAARALDEPVLPDSSQRRLQQRHATARPARLAWAGAALGVAGAVKFWAVVPGAVLLVLCLIVGEQRTRRTLACLAGQVAGFALLTAPFVLAAPVTFIRSTLLYQASRIRTFIP